MGECQARWRLQFGFAKVFENTSPWTLSSDPDDLVPQRYEMHDNSAPPQRLNYVDPTLVNAGYDNNGQGGPMTGQTPDIDAPGFLDDNGVITDPLNENLVHPSDQQVSSDVSDEYNEISIKAEWDDETAGKDDIEEGSCPNVNCQGWAKYKIEVTNAKLDMEGVALGVGGESTPEANNTIQGSYVGGQTFYTTSMNGPDHYLIYDGQEGDTHKYRMGLRVTTCGQRRNFVVAFLLPDSDQDNIWPGSNNFGNDGFKWRLVLSLEAECDACPPASPGACCYENEQTHEWCCIEDLDENECEENTPAGYEFIHHSPDGCDGCDVEELGECEELN